jgi:DnaK suppressor protein
MDEKTARDLLATERARVQALLEETEAAAAEDRESAADTGDIADSAQPLTDEERDDAVAGGLRERLAAIERAERRLDEGVYGLSVRSGKPIPEARLEADPAAELIAEEAGEA